MGCTPSKDVIASSSDCPTEIMFSNNANKEVNSGSAIPEKAPEKELKRYGCIGSQSDELLCSDNRNYGSELPTEENCKELVVLSSARKEKGEYKEKGIYFKIM
jgi:hypothetical protein